MKSAIICGVYLYSYVQTTLGEYEVNPVQFLTCLMNVYNGKHGNQSRKIRDIIPIEALDNYLVSGYLQISNLYIREKAGFQTINVTNTTDDTGLFLEYNFSFENVTFMLDYGAQAKLKLLPNYSDYGGTMRVTSTNCFIKVVLDIAIGDNNDKSLVMFEISLFAEKFEFEASGLGLFASLINAQFSNYLTRNQIESSSHFGSYLSGILHKYINEHWVARPYGTSRYGNMVTLCRKLLYL